MADVLQWPLVGRDALTEAFRPGGTIGEEASFRTLRRERLATRGVRISRRNAGRLAGQFVVFSSLNVDAARLARGGEREAARRAADAAAVVEAGAEFIRLRQLLQAVSGDQQSDILHGVIPDLPEAAEIEAILASLARALDSARSSAQLPSAGQVFAGQVIEHRGDTVLVRGTDGVRTLLPEWMARSIHRDEVGDVLVVVTVRLDAQRAVVEAVPGIAIPKPRVTQHGSGHLGSQAAAYGSRSSADLHLTAEDFRRVHGEPSDLRVLVPVTIEG